MQPTVVENVVSPESVQLLNVSTLPVVVVIFELELPKNRLFVTIERTEVNFKYPVLLFLQIFAPVNVT